MKKYFYLFICVLVTGFFSQDVFAQGCVAVKNMSSCSLLHNGEQPKGFQFSLNYRYFRSYKHFRGRHEETERVEEGSEVINNDNSINFAATYTFNNRFSASLTLPYIFIDRSSLYEHDRVNRYHTQSNGLGDIRLVGYLNTMPSFTNGNLVFGLGFKLPTGNYNTKDYFHKENGLVLLPVDQSIQPGDGGFGIITEVDFSHKLTGKFYGYVNGMYMFNPRNTNGVLRRETPYTIPATNEPIPLSNELSVTDQYMVRGGIRFVSPGIQTALGARMECIPVEDLIGKNDGFRRPGYIISIEPSFFYTTGQHTFGFNLPVALERNRTRNVVDIKRGLDEDGNPIHGDAAFADWLLSVTYVYRLAK